MPQQCTISGGKFQDASGNPIALGTVVFRMQQDALQSTTQICAGRPVAASLDSNGSISGTVKLWGPQAYLAVVTTALGLAAWSGTFTIPDSASHSLTP